MLLALLSTALVMPPLFIKQPVDKPISIYACKRANELMAFSYSNLYGLKATGLRFFTVYGPWGGQTYNVYLCKKILAGEKISVYNFGDMKRDFTYIENIVSGIKISLKKRFLMKF